MKKITLKDLIPLLVKKGVNIEEDNFFIGDQMFYVNYEKDELALCTINVNGHNVPLGPKPNIMIDSRHSLVIGVDTSGGGGRDGVGFYVRDGVDEETLITAMFNEITNNEEVITDPNVVESVYHQCAGINIDGDIIVINGMKYYINLRESILKKV